MELICYLHDGWHPQIRPAPATRAWMDASPESYAYRCLPLNIANAHGWEILTPAGFAVYWNGGSRPDDVIVQVDENMPSIAKPVGIFGEGVVTIHIQGIFRTPAGWNLYVSGSPNWFKDGIAPLTALVETDWSPYTFTMNWKLTRRNHWVRFEANEPICFVFPVRRNDLERVEPRFVPIKENKDLAKQFADWDVSRSTFQKEVVKNPPSCPADKWQKRYYRGLDMKDKAGVPDHQAKLRLRSFVG